MTPELKALNGLRFPACLLVFTQHLPGWSHPDHPWFARIAPIVMEQAHAAMPYFFVLSGFVLLHAYGAAIAPQGGGLAAAEVGRFLRRRLIRLFPLHWLGLLLILPWALLAGEARPWAFLAHLTLTQAMVPDIAVVGAYNAPSWSLSAELVFALAFPPLALLLAFISSRLRVALLMGVLLAPIAAAALLVLLAPERSGFLPLYINPLARLADFIAGMLLYLLWRQYRWRLDGMAWEILALGLFAAAIVFSYDLPQPYRYVAFFLPTTLLLTVVFAGGDGPLRRALSSDGARKLGRLAFAFYVVHFIVIRYVELTPLAQLPATDGARWALIPLLLILTLIGAAAIHFGFERRIEPWLQRKFSPAPPATS